MEISQYIKGRSLVHTENSHFLVDMNKTKSDAIYRVETRIAGDKQKTIQFDFIDVPGEWMEETKTEYNKLKEYVESSDVYVIAIDTPYLMYRDENVVTSYNRVDEITKVLDSIEIENTEYPSKLIIFCPVKCEAWVRNNHAEVVTEKVKHAYRKLINNLLNKKGVEMWIMPIQTAGSIEFSEMMEAKTFFAPGDNEGKPCSYDELTGILRLKDGTIMVDGFNEKDIEPAGDAAKRGVVNIPYAWYKINQSEFSPVLCEQPAYHILRFLVNKELSYYQEIKKNQKNANILFKLIDQLRNHPLTQYIEDYQKVVERLEHDGRIKESGDGFLLVREVIQED